MTTVFNDRMKQVLLLSVIFFLGYLIIKHLYVFVPGFLGAITFYILGRDQYNYLTIVRRWKKGWTSLLFILIVLLIFAGPIYFGLHLAIPRINELADKSDEVVAALNTVSKKISEVTGRNLLSEDALNNLGEKLAGLIPSFLNSTLNILANLAMMLFVLYYMYAHGHAMERYLSKFIPLKKQNVTILADETKKLITANAFGIPMISIVQGLTAAVGYWIFGVKDWGLWGFMTGLFAFFPVVGTMIIWVPLCIYLYAEGMEWQSIALGIYSLVVTGNVDYLTRISLLRKIGDVHPLVTIFGVIAGLSLFGFVGLIFGPLLISYFLVLIKIYMNEYVE